MNVKISSQIFRETRFSLSKVKSKQTSRKLVIAGTLKITEPAVLVRYKDPFMNAMMVQKVKTKVQKINLDKV